MKDHIIEQPNETLIISAKEEKYEEEKVNMKKVEMSTNTNVEKIKENSVVSKDKSQS